MWGLWEEFGSGSVWSNGWCSVLTNSALLWEGEWVFYQMREESGHKISWHRPLIFSWLSVWNRFFLQTQRKASILMSCQTVHSEGRFALPSLSPFPLKFLIASFPIPILIYNVTDKFLTHTVWLHRELEWSIKELPQTRRIHREELLVQGPLMSHTGWGGQGLGTKPRLDQRSQFKLGERAKRITGNCISKGPSKKKMLSRKKSL